MVNEVDRDQIIADNPVDLDEQWRAAMAEVSTEMLHGSDSEEEEEEEDDDTVASVRVPPDEEDDDEPIIARPAGGGGDAAVVVAAADDDGVGHQNIDGGVHLVVDNNTEGHGEEASIQRAIINLDEGELLGAHFDQQEEQEGPPPAPAIVGEEQDDPDRMILSNPEIEWAKQIKAAVEDDPDLDNLSDFAYAQYAIAEPFTGSSGSSMGAVLERVAAMQAFREEKGIRDTCSQAKKVLEDVMDLFPGFLLSLHFMETDGGYTFVFDSTKVLATEFSSNPKAYNIWVSTLYYVACAASPDFESTRNGLTFHVECEGFNFAKNFGIKVFSKIWPELGHPIPTQWKVLKHFHTSMFKNLLVSMAKRFIPRGIHRKMEVGCVCELGRLDKIFLVPNETAANQRFENNVLECLQRRFKNEKEFTL